MSETLETLGDLVLVLGGNSSETISVHDHLIKGSVLMA